MNFKTEMRERFDSLEQATKELREEIQGFRKEFVEDTEKRNLIAQHIRVAQASEASSLYKKQIEEDQDENLVGEMIDMGESE